MTSLTSGSRRPGAAARPVATPEALLVAVAVGAAAVVGLWWHDTGAIHTFGDWLTNAGRITGLLAGYSFVVLVFLMSRAPVLENGVGADRLARWHAAGGRYAVCLSVAHTLLVIWGYAVSAHESLVHQTGQLITAYPDVLMATVALGLLIGVGIVSMRAARARLRYETWYYLHFYTYLAVALSFSHAFATGADFIDNRAARVWWSALYIAVGAALVWYRIVVPIRAALRHRLKVAAVVPESAGAFSLHISGTALEELGAQPGQFLRWRFLTKDGWWQAHPFSLSAPPDPSLLRITVKPLGDHSAALRRLRPGTRVLAEGPYGALTAARRRRRKVLLLAGGVGITPLRSLFETLRGSADDIVLVYRANTDAELIFRTELDKIAAWQGNRVLYLVGPPGSDADPTVGRRLAGVLPDVAHRDVYLCGPPAMMAAARAALHRVGVPRRRVHTESFEF